MKIQINLMAMLFLAMSLTFTGCNDDDDDEDQPDTTPTQNTDSDPTPSFPMADATLIAIDTKTTQETQVGTFEIFIGTAVGLFFDANQALLDAGTVSINGSNLTQNSNNSYTYLPSLTEPEGLSFSTGTDWEVSGSANFPAFSASPAFDFPSVGDISGADIVDKSADYTISISSVSDADSIIYVVSGVTKTTAGNVTSCTFSADELAGAPTGQGIIQAAPYAYSDQEFSGKTVYFVKEKVVSQSVTIE
jgi:hypothetical protein